MNSFATDEFEDLLKIYYKRLFPYGPFYRWLSYGSVNPNTFPNREMSFTLRGDIYIRYQSFDKIEDFEYELQKKCPEKIDIGGIYNIKPRLKRMNKDFEVEEKELVFDIDMTDYDNVRTCCSEAEICNKCWKLLAFATKILDIALRNDFGYKHLLWVFSGRRGIHCWVCDEAARKLDQKVRSDIAEYLQLLSREDQFGKLVHLYKDKLHPSIRRAVEIIKEDFVEVCVEGQDMLGTVERMKKVLNLFGNDDEFKQEIENEWMHLNSSVDRWERFVEIFYKKQSKNSLKTNSKYLVDEIMLQWAYPRLDINVTKSSNHLLKSPFCLHPKTGKVCVPFSAAAVFKFKPESVPTIRELAQEIEKFDEKESLISENTKRKVKDYKKTSMYKGVLIFEEFLRNLEESWKLKKNKVEDSMEF